MYIDWSTIEAATEDINNVMQSEAAELLSKEESKCNRIFSRPSSETLELPTAIITVLFFTALTWELEESHSQARTKLTPYFQ